jgi:hypothetical protein
MEDVMNKFSLKMYILGFALTLFFSSCTTIPKMVRFNTDYYEDDDVKVWYAIGTTVHYLEIENKTNDEIVIDNNRCSIIAPTNQTRTLNLLGQDSHIPPKSSLVLSANQQTFFYTDIYSNFDLKDESHDADIYYLSEKSIIDSWIGKKIRLYLPMVVGARNKILDIPLIINGVKTTR